MFLSLLIFATFWNGIRVWIEYLDWFLKNFCRFKAILLDLNPLNSSIAIWLWTHGYDQSWGLETGLVLVILLKDHSFYLFVHLLDDLYKKLLFVIFGYKILVWTEDFYWFIGFFVRFMVILRSRKHSHLSKANLLWIHG